MAFDKAGQSPKDSGVNQEEACRICIALKKFQSDGIEDL